MRPVNAASVAIVLVLIAPIVLLAQSSQPGPSVSVPRLIHVSGVFQPVDGQPPAPVADVTFSFYAEQEGGASVWQETQAVTFDKAGRFTVLLGATQAEGIPPEVFASAEAHWMSILVKRVGEQEQPRVRIASVPYALRASNAETLGGIPASSYALAPSPRESDRGVNIGGVKEPSLATGERPVRGADVVQAGMTNFLAKYVSTTDVGPSSIFESGGLVGVGTSTPLDNLHVTFNNISGGQTGLAVQNLGNTASSYSGMLFYDQNNQLGQFQGFNNFTHEYRINNIARNGGGQLNGSINFMTGGTSRFLVTSAGNIGIGTTAPSALLDVSNALVPTSANANIAATSYGPSNFGSEIVGRKARGTAAAPSAVLNGDALSIWGGKGYGATGFSTNYSGISMLAAENWTDTAQGTLMNFWTTPQGATNPTVRMTVSSNGNVGIGTFGPGSNLEVSNATNTAPFGGILLTSFTVAPVTGSVFLGRRARGTSGAPTAVQNGDGLISFVGQGYGATAFSIGPRGGMFVRAAENWTDTAQGSSLAFGTTATGTTGLALKMILDPDGNVGIGTLLPEAPLEVSRTGSDAATLMTVYTNGNGNKNPVYLTRLANGTPAAPTAVQSGNILGAWVASGYGATQFGEVTGGMGVIAQENFTDTAQGSATGFLATPLGSTTPHLYAAILPSGNVGLGDWSIPGGAPTALDKLQVFGDIRIGTTGTNGCIKDFSGTGILGTCASDRRFKRDITPFGPVLRSLTALQPVHYFWRAADFPDRHFGESRSYGLIAQEVEQILPELVETGADGFKAVNYSKLPLLTIQAVKELKAENDALKQRVAELERMFAEMLATAARR